VAYGRDVWVANPSARAVDRIGPPYSGVGAIATVNGSPRLLAAGEGAIWAAGGTRLWRIDPGTGRVISRIRLPFEPKALAVGARGVWLVDAAHNRVIRLDPATRRIVAQISVGLGPQAVAVGNRSIWVANRREGTVSRIDPRRNSVTATIRVGSTPIDLVAGLGAVWVVRDTK
jgi:YVTN family beta-propeller protein